MKYLIIIKDILLDIIRPIVRPIVRVALSSKHKNEVIIRVDGGICSQIHFYLIGRYFADKGYKVLYDLSWYKLYGLDTLGKNVRNFDLLKLNPNMELEMMPTDLVHFFISNFLKSDYKYSKVDRGDCSWRDECPPVYMGDYYYDYPDLFKRILPKYFKIEELKNCLNEENKKVLAQIETCEAVAIHVRRGDLANYNNAYGAPCSFKYFIDAVNLFNDKITEFFIFSDEPTWCKNELIYQLPVNKNYQIVDINGSDKGYMDLVLMSCCKHTITSKGSLGKYSAMVNNNKDRVVVLNDDKTEYIWKDVFENCHFIEN